MNAKLAVVLTVAAALSTGCMGPVAAPPRQELLSGPAVEPAFPELTVAVLQSARIQGGGASGEFIESAEVLDRYLDNLRGQFKSVIRVDMAEQASRSGADVVAALEASFYAPLTISDRSLSSVSARFLTPDGTPLGAVHGKGEAIGTKDTPFGIFAGRAPKAIRIAITRSLQDFDRNLAAFEPLKALKSGARPVPAQAAAPSARPAPVAPVSPLLAPGYRLPENENKFALVVGVESYQGLPAAEHAVRDAKAVKAHLLTAGYPERNVVFLADAQAGKSGLEKYLDAWLPKNTDEKSTVFFYFSGHGAPNAEKGDAYLMPWDGDAKFVESTGYPVKRLYEKLAALKAKRVLVAMDACFSGAGGRSVLAKGLRPLVAKVDLGAASAGRVVLLTASAADEVTGTDEASGHGLFTYHLLKGLSAKGGKATFQELYDYLSPKVRDAARRDNRDQTPQLVGDGRATL